MFNLLVSHSFLLGTELLRGGGLSCITIKNALNAANIPFAAFV